MSGKCRRVVAAAGVFALASALGAATRALVVGGADVAFADPPAQVRRQNALPVAPPSVAVLRETVDGREIASVVVNGVPVMRMRAKYGRWSPYERAQAVAERLRPLGAQGVRVDEIRAARVRGQYVVQARGVDLVTVMPFDAQLVNSTRADLAGLWAANLRTALGRRTVAPAGSTVVEGSGPYSAWPSTPSANWAAPERYDDRWVPIVSVLSGLKLGIARVNGPVSKLKYVQAVAQFETHWKDILEVDLFVPISTEVPGKVLDRVEGCAVTGFVDYDF